MDIPSSFTADEKSYQKKFNSVIESSKILSLPFHLTCAICRTMIKRDQITDVTFYTSLCILLCKTCAIAKQSRINGSNTSNKCDWCEYNFASNESRLVNCVGTYCNRKFCENCVRKSKEVAKQNKVKTLCFCAFCEPRLIREDRAIYYAILTDVKKEHEALEIPECIICEDNEAKISFVPCGHTCLCHTCLPKFEEKFNVCPLCRGSYNDKVDGVTAKNVLNKYQLVTNAEVRNLIRKSF